MAPFCFFSRTVSTVRCKLPGNSFRRASSAAHTNDRGLIMADLFCCTVIFRAGGSGFSTTGAGAILSPTTFIFLLGNLANSVRPLTTLNRRVRQRKLSASSWTCLRTMPNLRRRGRMKGLRCCGKDTVRRPYCLSAAATEKMLF